MPNLFTLPGPRSGPNNFLAQEFLGGGDYTIAAGTTYYASLFRMYWADHNFPNFTNHGTLWNLRDTDTAAVISGMNVIHVTNTGTMIAEATNGNAGAIFVGSSGTGVTNSGSVYAIANGNAVAIEHWDPDALIQNTGLIAAYAPSGSTWSGGGVGQAIGVAMFNGGVLVNGSGGSILAEGINTSTAIIFGRGSPFEYDAVIQNDGRIEAHSLDSSPAYGIQAGGVTSEIIYFFNSGLLKADIAWSSYDSHPLYAPMAMDRLTNNAGGTIVGRIQTGRGEDSLLNSGSIVGNVALGDENDFFDTSAGVFTGSADLGWHNDVFIGSAAGDVVTGNRGDDQLTGNGGNDLLLGASGADLIVGGAGNDGLYGEFNDDHIVTLGGDRAYGGDQNDLIEAGDLAFALISGGAGYDTLQLGVGVIKLNLGAAIAAGRLEGIEQIDLQTGQQLAISAGNVAALAGGTLDIIGDSGSHVALVGAWIEGVQTVRDGTICRSFSLGGETLFVDAEVTVEIVGSMPAGFTGLDAIAGGGAAPLAGSVPGGELFNPVQQISIHLNRTMVVDEGETWQATDQSVITGYSLTDGLVNRGVIEMTNNPDGYYNHTITNDIAFIDNGGTIRATGLGNAYVDAINIRGTLENSGTVEAFASSGQARAVALTAATEGPTFVNYGGVSAHSSTGIAIGVQLGNSTSYPGNLVGANHGTIEAVGGAGTTALALLTSTPFLNEGTIVAANSAVSGATDATAVQLYSDSWPVNVLVNRGSIIGPTAIRSDGGSDEVINFGWIQGAIKLGAASDIVENRGAIVGRVELGSETDLYLGAAATSGAEVEGGAGIDLLVGGAQVDRLDGGDGNDLLIGGAGADVLIGGAGADRFFFRSSAESTAASADTIEGFETGVDEIDLSALAPSTVSLSVSGAITTITALTAGGAVTVQVSGSVALSDINIIAGNPVLTGTPANEVLVATPLTSEIRADAGDDVLLGTSANDRLNGGAGSDLMVGGQGNDVYIVDGYGDRLTERFGEGIDHAFAYGNYLLPDNIENITLMVAGEAQGNTLDNIFQGSSGNDSLIGRGGNDIFIGALGADVMLSNYLGSDVFIYHSSAESTSSARDTISGFEYGIDKIDLSDVDVISISWNRVLNMWDSYEEVIVETGDGPMAIRVNILNVATSGLAMSDFILPVEDARNDFDGDGRSDILWRNDDGRVAEWLGQTSGGFIGNTNANHMVGADWGISGIGDFNGDGRDDVIWRNDDGRMIEWLGQTNGGFHGNPGVNNNVATSWQVAGVGDFNGDGRDDILWRNDNGTVTDWLGRADGRFDGNTTNANVKVGPDWDVAGVGDFNGDGRDDVIWRNDDGRMIEWLGQANGGFRGNTGANYSVASSWHVAGVGDFNGDNRDDILWRNDNGTVTDWLGRTDGRFDGNTDDASIKVGPDWQVASIGDFNGDSRDDVIWRNDDGRMIEWLGQATGGFAGNAGANYNVDPSWHVQSPDILWA